MLVLFVFNQQQQLVDLIYWKNVYRLPLVLLYYHRFRYKVARKIELLKIKPKLIKLSTLSIYQQTPAHLLINSNISLYCKYYLFIVEGMAVLRVVTYGSRDNQFMIFYVLINFLLLGWCAVYWCILINCFVGV